MALLTRRSVILAKLEAGYGTDASPGTNDAILCTVPTITPTGDILDRDFVRTSISLLPFVVGAKTVELTFDTEIKGSGTSTSSQGILPEFDTLLRIMGMTPSISSAGSPAAYTASYSPISTNFPSATIYVYYDGLVHKIVGCRGRSMAMSMEAGGFGKISWAIRGLYQAPTDVSMPTPQFKSNQKPPIVKSMSFQVGTDSLTIQAVNLTWENAMADRRHVNASDIIDVINITGRTVTGSINPEMTLVATHDFFGIWQNATTKALSGTLGSTNGNIVTLSAPSAQYQGLRYGDRDGIRILDIDLRLSASSSSGDDELNLKFF